MTHDVPLSTLLGDVAACRLCEAHLPLGPRPVVQMGYGAKIAIIGQAPGTRVHETGIPWHDPSGDHLREWLAIDDAVFYDRSQVALMPMGLCYPGRAGAGDAPPRPECAPQWHQRLLAYAADNVLLLLVGQYAHRHYLGSRRKRTLTDTVRHFENYLPDVFVLPHPSWRSRLWIQKNPWFTTDVLPALRAAVHARLSASSSLSEETTP